MGTTNGSKYQKEKEFLSPATAYGILNRYRKSKVKPVGSELEISGRENFGRSASWAGWPGKTRVLSRKCEA